MNIKPHFSLVLGALAVLAFTTAPAQTIQPGFDLFETDPASTYDNVNVPPGTFLPYCDAGFAGQVALRGIPIDCFNGVCNLSPTDTIVQRLAPAPSPSATIPIQIVQLQLQSVQPFVVNCSGGPQTWNLYASVPPNDPGQTQGTMTINQNYPRGGTFTSTLPVQPYITFTRVSDNATVGPFSGGTITFQVTNPQTWCRRPNPIDNPVGDVVVAYDATSAFFPGILCPSSPGGIGRRRKVLTVEQAALAAHGVLPAEKKHHYKCFDIPNNPPLGLPVTLADQFGSQNATVMEPRYLCPPAIKNSQFGSLDSPHLKCYRIQPTAPPPNAVVDLDGQFGYEKRVTLGPADMLCTPANKEVIFPNPIPPPNGPPPASPHYTCYPILGTTPQPTVVSLETQFGVQPNDVVGQPRYLCAPTIKTVGPNSYGSLHEPHLKCYDITPPHDPPHIVNLKTQFGVENNVPVGNSRLVCIPVNKRPTECNGLIALSKTSWSAVSVTFTGATYNVYKGSLTSLPGSMTTGFGTCLPGASGLSGPTYNDPGTPAPGAGFFYLIDAAIPSHDGPVEGTIGYAQSAMTETERPNVNSCSP